VSSVKRRGLEFRKVSIDPTIASRPQKKNRPVGNIVKGSTTSSCEIHNMIDQRTEKGSRTSGAEGRQENPDRQGGQSDKTSQFFSISLPRGGGAVRGIGEKFAANPVTSTGSMTVPIAVSPGRSGFAPQLSLSYDSGSWFREK
jgi:virulence plasmid B protein